MVGGGSPLQLEGADDHVDVIVIGAGIGGLYAIHAMRQLGLSVQGYEAGSGVGGTWYWNRYPGARCDTESLEYSFQFDKDLQDEWVWSERYAAQPEILAYTEHIADRFDLRQHIAFETRVVEAIFDDEANRWRVRTDDGRRSASTWLYLATGGIAVAKTPSFPGIDRFAGTSVHTARWPAEGIDVEGKRVAVIGTGSSAVQAVPELAIEAEHVYVLQRSPNYVVPAQNHERDIALERRVKASYDHFRRNNDTYPNGFGTLWTDRSDTSALDVAPAERQRRFERSWETGGFAFLFTFGDLTSNTEAAETAAAFIRGKIAELVHDPAVAELLSPRHIFGCRRLIVGSGYFEAFNRPDVTLVDVSRDAISEITPTGIRYGDQHLDVDVIVYATGFEDQTASTRSISIIGPDGPLAEAWDSQPANYLGVATAGFPNLFLVNMPGAPSIATNMVTNTEYTVDFVAGCIDHARRNGFDRVEVDPVAQAAWTDHVDSLGEGKVYQFCHNLYTGLDSDGRRYVMPYLGVPAYLHHIRTTAVAGYGGFAFTNRESRTTSHRIPQTEGAL